MATLTPPGQHDTDPDAGYWAEDLLGGGARFRAKIGGLHCSLCTGTSELTPGWPGRSASTRCTPVCSPEPKPTSSEPSNTMAAWPSARSAPTLRRPASPSTGLAASAMPTVLVVSDAEVRRLLDVEELAVALEEALVALCAGEVSVPPRVAARTPAGLLGSMPGYLPGAGLAAKLVSVYPSNPAVGLPSHQAVIAVFDEATGSPVAFLAGTWITAIRTAVTSVVAARALSPADGPVAVLGAGVQGDAHLEAAAALLPSRPRRLWARNKAAAAALAARRDATVVEPTAEAAVRGAAVVLCCTDAREPLLEDAWVGPGAHVGSVGTGAELPPELLSRARVVVESRAASLPPPAGAVELQGWPDEALTELGEIAGGRAVQRAGPEQVTVFKSTGHAVEDVAAAAVVLRRARAEGVGRSIDL